MLLTAPLLQPMAELHHRATWDARIAEAELQYPRAAAWIAEALDLGERALRASSAAAMDNSQRLAESCAITRGRARTCWRAWRRACSRRPRLLGAS